MRYLSLGIVDGHQTGRDHTRQISRAAHRCPACSISPRCSRQDARTASPVRSNLSTLLVDDSVVLKG